MICEGLRTLLLAQSSVTDLVGQQIYVSAAPQEAGLPYIVMDRVRDDKHKSLGGTLNARHVEVDIECWHSTPGKAAAISQIVSDFLEDYSGAAGNETILSSHHMDEDDSYDYRGSGSDIIDYVTILNFEFQYTE